MQNRNWNERLLVTVLLKIVTFLLQNTKYIYLYIMAASIDLTHKLVISSAIAS